MTPLPVRLTTDVADRHRLERVRENLNREPQFGIDDAVGVTTEVPRGTSPRPLGHEVREGLPTLRNDIA
jgi:hypothetical protein